jgi:hypothetical protein
MIGYWPSSYWCTNYWMDDYWLDYGTNILGGSMYIDFYLEEEDD